MKKVYLLLVLLTMSVFLICGCGKKGYIEISYSELSKKTVNKDTFILFIGRASCSACSIYKEVLNQHANDHKNIDIYYIDLDKLSIEEQAKFDATYDYSVTPTSFIIIDGSISSLYDKFTGYTIYDDLMDRLKERGIIGG